MTMQEIRSLFFTAKQLQDVAAQKPYEMKIPIRTIQEAMKNRPVNPHGVTLDATPIGEGRGKVWICSKDSAIAWIAQYAAKKKLKP